MVSLVVSVVDFGTVGYNETETDNTAAFSLRAASQPAAAAGGGEAPSGEAWWRGLLSRCSWHLCRSVLKSVIRVTLQDFAGMLCSETYQARLRRVKHRNYSYSAPRSADRRGRAARGTR